MLTFVQFRQFLNLNLFITFQLDIDGSNLARGAAARLSHASPLRVIDENEPPESNQSTPINHQVPNLHHYFLLLQLKRGLKALHKC